MINITSSSLKTMMIIYLIQKAQIFLQSFKNETESIFTKHINFTNIFLKVICIIA